MLTPVTPAVTFGVAQGRLEVLQIYRLLQSIHQKDKAHITKMVTIGVQNLINLTEPQQGIGALHLAVMKNNEDMASFLLSQGAHPDIQDKRGRTPSMLAAEQGRASILELLAKSDASMRLNDAEGKGVLFYCIEPTWHSRCLQVVLKYQPDINNVSLHGTHVFQLMCEKAQEHGPMCLRMLDEGADPNANDEKTGMTALMTAVRGGCPKLARAMLKKGANPNTLNQKRHSAVHYAAKGGFLEIIQILSAFSADMGVLDMDTCTPLHYAAETGDANCCKFLAQRGCNPKLKNQNGHLPRQIAKDFSHKPAMKELKKAEARAKKGDKGSGTIPLTDLWALTLHDWSNEYEQELRKAFGEDNETVSSDAFMSVLEELKAPVDEDQILVVISAHDTAKQGVVNVSEFIKGTKYIQKLFLLAAYVPKQKKAKKGGKGKKKGAFVPPIPICKLPGEYRPRRPDGGPPYFMVEEFHSPSDSCRPIQEIPAKHPFENDSAWYQDKPQKVFVNINDCVRKGDIQVLDHAFRNGASVSTSDQYFKDPLMVACATGNYKMAQYFLNKGGDRNRTDQFLWTPLHHAAHGGHLNILELLVNAGVNLEAVSISESTPLMRAIQGCHPECVDFLIQSGANVLAENKRGDSCLELATVFANMAVYELIQAKIESLPKPKAKK